MKMFEVALSISMTDNRISLCMLFLSHDFTGIFTMKYMERGVGGRSINFVFCSVQSVQIYSISFVKDPL